MGEITAASNKWRKGGIGMTMEEWRRHEQQARKAPSGGTPIDNGADRRPAAAAWSDVARCRVEQKPTSFFFPEPGDQTVARIRRYCAGCDVRDECKAYAIGQNLWIGWYGGESPKQRANKAERWSGPDRAHGTPSRAQYGARGFDKQNACLCRPCSDAWAASRAKEAERMRRKNRAARQKAVEARRAAL
jgi:hypothetical protein